MKGPPSWKKFFKESKGLAPDDCDAERMTESTILASIGLINVRILSPAGLRPWLPQADGFRGVSAIGGSREDYAFAASGGVKATRGQTCVSRMR
jgi:hypothetical protein